MLYNTWWKPACAIQTHLVHLSTDFIFDGEDGPYRESDDPNPLSYYGKSKLMGEEIIQKSEVKAADSPAPSKCMVLPKI
ncbi:MAG: sugar nucleotide-binding protein [Owenweeksia sp.]|nr:sugar nucleotide-binding protein [Owenweeksia sp.]